jgi:hypothetical protein
MLLQLCNDVLGAMIDHCDPRALLDLSAICKRLRRVCDKIAPGLVATRLPYYGHNATWRKQMRAARCLCGIWGWNIRWKCDCHVECSKCERRLPIVATVPAKIWRDGSLCELRMCKYGCGLSRCDTCDCPEVLTSQTIDRFMIRYEIDGVIGRVNECIAKYSGLLCYECCPAPFVDYLHIRHNSVVLSCRAIDHLDFLAWSKLNAFTDPALREGVQDKYRFIFHRVHIRRLCALLERYDPGNPLLALMGGAL